GSRPVAAECLPYGYSSTRTCRAAGKSTVRVVRKFVIAGAGRLHREPIHRGSSGGTSNALRRAGRARQRSSTQHRMANATATVTSPTRSRGSRMSRSVRVVLDVETLPGLPEHIHVHESLGARVVVFHPGV